MLAGCSTPHWRLFHPDGPVARTELNITLIDVGVMCCIILPTVAAIIWCLWRYRRTRNAAYRPDWSSSIPLEIAMWGVPLVVVGILAFVGQRGVYMVNPYRPTVLANSKQPPLTVNVIATDWQWVFVYPKQGVATVDDLVVPKGRNIAFRLTSTAVVNDFYIPQLAAMIDVMPGMRTRDVMRASHLGTWRGFSADFSGAGFSWMHFHVHAVADATFAKWVKTLHGDGGDLDDAVFNKVARPTVNLHQTVQTFGTVVPGLFDHVVAAIRAGKIYPIKEDMTRYMAKSMRRHAAYLHPTIDPQA